MRLANSNREIGGFIELGREDNGQRVGLVGKDLLPVTPKQLKSAEQKLVSIAQRLDPPMEIRWFEFDLGGMTTIVVKVPGRPLGGWYQDENGVTKTGSGSHPIIAGQDRLRRWALEVVPELEARSSHERIRPVLSVQLSWIPPYEVNDYSNLGKQVTVPGQVILRLHHDAGGTGLRACVTARSSGGRLLCLPAERGTTIRPTAEAAVHPDTQSLDGAAIPVSFRLSDPAFTVGSRWVFATYAMDTLGWWWCQETDEILLPPSTMRLGEEMLLSGVRLGLPDGVETSPGYPGEAE